jgi:gag-polypeptide of LTR copia-type
MAMSSNPIQFTHQINTILNSDNYLLWKSQILAIMRGHGLISFIDGSQDPPSLTINSSDGTTSTNPAFLNWHKQDQLILAWIFNSLSPSILAQVINCETSRQLWIEINQMHTSQSMARVLELKLKLQTSKKGGTTCVQFLQYMQGIADQLRSVGAEISDQELVLYTLQGLGTEFDNFVTTISLRTNSVTMSELRSLIFSHEARQQANLASFSTSMANLAIKPAATTIPGSDAQSHSALYVGNHPHDNNSSGYFNYQRRGRGNYRGNFRGRARGRSPFSDSDNIQCHICLKWGHTSAKCYHRFNSTYTTSSIHELGQVPTAKPVLWCDNLGATFMAANPVIQARTKHIELDIHFIRDKVVAHDLHIQFLCSADQIADIFTKSLASTRFAFLRDKLTVFDKPLGLRGAINDNNSAQMDISSRDINGVKQSPYGEVSYAIRIEVIAIFNLIIK